jgi:Tol biopolymer transport system component
LLSGDPVLIAEKVIWQNQGQRRAGFSVSTQGFIAYRPERSARRQLTWFDREGRSVGTLGPPDDTTASPELSRDGTRVVFVRRGAQGAGLGAGEGASGSVDVWMNDGMRATRLPFDGIDYPLWSPDGNSIGFLAVRNGKFGEYRRPVDGAGSEELLFEQPAAVRHLNALTSWSRDDRYLLFDAIDHGQDIWVLDRLGDGTPRPFLHGDYEERLAHFSPDTRWVAYQSHESGRAEIYITPFPMPSGRSPVSTAGGAQPRWSHDGKELYWIAPDATLMAAPISEAGKPGAPVALFQTRIYLGGTGQPQRGQYNVAPNGRFLINTDVGDEGGLPITIVQNWKPR